MHRTQVILNADAAFTCINYLRNADDIVTYDTYYAARLDDPITIYRHLKFLDFCNLKICNRFKIKLALEIYLYIYNF